MRLWPKVTELVMELQLGLILLSPDPIIPYPFIHIAECFVATILFPKHPQVPCQWPMISLQSCSCTKETWEKWSMQACGPPAYSQLSWLRFPFPPQDALSHSGGHWPIRRQAGCRYPLSLQVKVTKQPLLSRCWHISLEQPLQGLCWLHKAVSAALFLAEKPPVCMDPLQGIY